MSGAIRAYCSYPGIVLRRSCPCATAASVVRRRSVRFIMVVILSPSSLAFLEGKLREGLAVPALWLGGGRGAISRRFFSCPGRGERGCNCINSRKSETKRTKRDRLVGFVLFVL